MKRKLKLSVVVERALAKGLAAMDLRARVAASLPKKAPRAVRVIAVGKAAPRMAEGVIDRWGSRSMTELLVVTTDQTPVSKSLAKRADCLMRAAHPIPDRRSVAAAEEALAMAARSSNDKIPLLVLVSGGASALLCAPKETVTLQEKQTLTKRLLASNATIQTINAARKRLSRIKGGGLARAAAPTKVWTRIASDVIAGRPSDVGSGPSVTDREGARKQRGMIVASPEELAKSVARELVRAGLVVKLLPPSQSSVATLAHEYTRLARSIRRGHAIVRAAEPSLPLSKNLKRTAKGGRSTHLAMLVGGAMAKMEEEEEEGSDLLFMAAATDGVDGSSDTAGAIVTSDSFRDQNLKERIRSALARFDTGTLATELGLARAKNPSGQNLADVHVLVRNSRRDR